MRPPHGSTRVLPGASRALAVWLVMQGPVVPSLDMLNLDERRFYRQLRGPAIAMGGSVGRLENEVESGWPDVLIRFYPNLHLWVELKIARGPNARVKIRPEQINWAEEHRGKGGKVILLAQNSEQQSEFWAVSPENIRHCSKYGCLDQPRYALRQWPSLLRSWIGLNDLQPKDRTHPKERSRLAGAKKEDLGTGAVVPLVRHSRLPDSRHNRRSRNPESPWGDP